MRSRSAAVALTLVLVACGDSSPKATEDAATATSAESAPITTIGPAMSSGPEPSTTQASSGPPPTRSTPSSAVATTVAPVAATTGAVQTTVAGTAPRGTGLIQGTATRDCSGNPASGGGCFNQSGGVAGAVVELRSPGGTVLQTTTTDAAGLFSFRSSPGRYVIREAATGVSQERDVAAGRTTFVGLVLPPG